MEFLLGVSRRPVKRRAREGGSIPASRGRRRLRRLVALADKPHRAADDRLLHARCATGRGAGRALAAHDLPVLIVGDVHGDLERLFAALKPYPADEWPTIFL